VSELNDSELEELERRVSAAFAGTRPRRGFEDELWARCLLAGFNEVLALGGKGRATPASFADPEATSNQPPSPNGSSPS